MSKIEGLTNDRDAWKDTAALNLSNAVYYKGLLNQCAEYLKPGAFTCDDGSISGEPLRAKIPELVEQLARQRAAAWRALSLAQSMILAGESMTDEARAIFDAGFGR